MLKKILIDIRYLQKKPTGIAVGLKAFLKQLEEMDLSLLKFYVLYHNKNMIKSDKFVAIKINAKPFSIKEQIEFYKIIKKYKIDIFYSHHFVSPIFRGKAKTVNFIHDLIPLRCRGSLSKLGYTYYYLMNYWTINKSDIILANSYATMQDIVSTFNRKDIKVVYYAIDKEKLQLYNDNIINKLGLQKNKYFLFVSSLKKHKNYINTIKAFELFNKNKEYKLVIVGSGDIKMRINGRGIIYTGYINDAEVNSLYKNATALLFVSFVEGFGLPILEAQYHKCPVITSNVSSMPEVAGNGALFVDPFDIYQIQENMKIVLNDYVLRRKLIENGLKNIERFSWKKLTDEIVNIFFNL